MLLGRVKHALRYIISQFLHFVKAFFENLPRFYILFYKNYYFLEKFTLVMIQTDCSKDLHRSRLLGEARCGYPSLLSFRYS